jgi:K+-transporting ATPase ATPase C chain
MIRQFLTALILLLVLTLLTGVVYPLAVTGVAQVIFPFQANGSLIEKNGVFQGSQLIGQDFTNPEYFWGRISATSGSPYTAFDPAALTGSSGSNLGPLSQMLEDAVRQRVDALHAADPGNTLPIPVDLVTASASGLDPHISIAAAYYQAPRVAHARGLAEKDIITLVEQYTEDRQLTFLGEPRVNVLLLNQALDAIK